MRTGTRTVRAPPLMTSPPAMMSGRLARTASRTFSSWRSQSRAPRENSSYHFAAPAVSPRLPPASSIRATRTPFPRAPLLLGEQRRDVAERLLGAVLVVAVFGDQALLHDRDLLTRVLVRARGRGHQPQHVAALLEQVLLDRLAHPRVARELELLARLEGHHGLADHFLTEGQLARIRHLDLLLDRAQEALVRGAALAGDGIGDLAVIERGLDLVEVLLEQLLRLLLEGGEHGAVHVFLHPAVVEFLAGGHQAFHPGLLLLRVHARITLDTVLEGEQQLHAGKTVGVAAGDGVGDRVH